MESRILLISPFFFPEMISTGKYNTSLAKELTKHAKLSVISLHPFYPDWVVKPTEADVPGVQIYRGGRMLHFSKHPIVRRIVLEIGFTLHVFSIILRRKVDYDNVIGVLPPSFFFYSILRILPKKCKRVAIIHDLQSVYASNNSVGGRIFSQVINYFESSILRSMDKVVYLSNSMKSRAEEEFQIESTNEKSFVAYPFININPYQKSKDQKVDIGGGKRLNLVYSGALSEKQNPNQLMQLFEEVIKLESMIDCYVFSSGPVFDRKKKENDNERIFFRDLVAQDDVPELYHKSTVQLIPQIPGSSEASIPSKLPNLIFSGCPIFAITDPHSELSEILKSFEGTKTENSWDVEAIKHSLVDFVVMSSDMPKEKLIEERKSSPLFDQFCLESLVSKILH